MNLLFSIVQNDMLSSANHNVKQIALMMAMGEDTKRKDIRKIA
jgi:hypothetical protein